MITSGVKIKLGSVNLYGHPLLTCNYDGADACIVSAVQDSQLVVFRCNSNNNKL